MGLLLANAQREVAKDKSSSAKRHTKKFRKCVFTQSGFVCTRGYLQVDWHASEGVF